MLQSATNRCIPHFSFITRQRVPPFLKIIHVNSTPPKQPPYELPPLDDSYESPAGPELQHCLNENAEHSTNVEESPPDSIDSQTDFFQNVANDWVLSGFGEDECNTQDDDDKLIQGIENFMELACHLKQNSNNVKHVRRIMSWRNLACIVNDVWDEIQRVGRRQTRESLKDAQKSVALYLYDGVKSKSIDFAENSASVSQISSECNMQPLNFPMRPSPPCIPTNTGETSTASNKPATIIIDDEQNTSNTMDSHDHQDLSTVSAVQQALPCFQDGVRVSIHTISLYCELLDKVYPNISVLSAYLFQSLRRFKYKNSKHKNQFKKFNIFELDICLIPTYWQEHYGLGIIFGKRQAYAYIDSLNMEMGFKDVCCFHNGLPYIGTLIFLQVILYDLLPNEAERLGFPFDDSSWREIQFDLPRQIGGVDCGIFVMGRMKRIVLGNDIGTIRQSEISKIRKELKADIQTSRISTLDKENILDQAAILLKCSSETAPLKRKGEESILSDSKRNRTANI